MVHLFNMHYRRGAKILYFRKVLKYVASWVLCNSGTIHPTTLKNAEMDSAIKNLLESVKLLVLLLLHMVLLVSIIYTVNLIFMHFFGAFLSRPCHL